MTERVDCVKCKHFILVSAQNGYGVNMYTCFEYGEGRCHFEPKEEEAWNSYHGEQVMAPEGLFRKIYEDSKQDTEDEF